ncbi:DUF2919 family protein [Salmonella enterica]|nr:DUF2919 family protein [Salmonella enterica]EDU6784885.1 DUF2919 domain-containing protein [Salmonella enterica subsp. enterica serovar Gaminara]EGT2786624.1 DUF2919 domain-containing protein [Salmonella enterica subsp. enterica serovar Carmel]EAO4222632.1 DUF2919 family protein [Salmonella enterica]EAR9568942.1 DUF2919 family protein [Salmonella enterica]
MRPRTFYPERYYNRQGVLGVPYWFWLLMLWQSRAWWAVAFFMVVSAASGGKTDGRDALWWWLLLAGAPAIVMFFCYPLRECQNISRRSYILTVSGAVVLLMTTLYQWAVTSAPERSLWISFACFDTVLVSVLCGSRHLRDVFWSEKPYISGR